MLPVPAPRSGNASLNKIPSWDATFVVCQFGPQGQRAGRIGGGCWGLYEGSVAKSCMALLHAL